ncbi:MAG: copper chaperone PCu(A)C [Anaerolineae bacterium]|nr:copper chaperone PCu(A)C [Anaerolineae bacterium]
MRKLWWLLVACLGIVPVVHAQALDTPVLITSAWARPALAETGVGAVYMTLENVGETALRLVAADSKAAGMAQIHESKMVNSVMQMRQVEGIDLAPGESAALEPGGYHIMLMDLVEDLTVGSAISLNLTFEVDGSPEPLTIVTGAPVLDEAPPASPFVVVDAWARATAVLPEADATPDMAMPGHNMSHGDGEVLITSDVSAAYMRILNRGEADDALIGATSDAAAMVEIHETKMDNGVMKMRPVESIAVLVHEPAVLEPGGQHVMMMGVKRGLVAGDAILVTLKFSSGLELPVGVPVRDIMNP